MPRSDKDFEKHVANRTVRPPKTLYKYASTDSARAILRAGTLRFQSPLNYNDPFDSQWDGLWFIRTPECKAKERALLSDIAYGRGSYPTGTDPLHRQALDAAISEFNARRTEDERVHAREDFLDQCAGPAKSTNELADHVRGIRERMRVLCLSEHDRSMLMWSHYAEQHRGVVIGFDSEQLESGYRRPLERVSYSADLPMLFDADAWARSAIFGVPMPEIDYEPLVLTKARCWEYESEWRFVWITPRGTTGTSDDRKFPREALVELVFGCQTDQSTIVELSQLARAIQPNVSIASVSTHRGRFDLVKEPTD
jgi:hypothetical protein